VATAKSGARSALAKSLGVTRSAVSQWLSEGGTTPTAETALRLREWVHPDEDKKQSPGRVSPRPEPKTRVRKSVYEKQTKVRKKG
jgi:transcriptional regulator with XRE-family HTH domain